MSARPMSLNLKAAAEGKEKMNSSCKVISLQQILLLEIFLFIAGRRSFIAAASSRVASTASQFVELSFKNFDIYPGATKSSAQCPPWFCNAENDLRFWPEGISLQNIEDAKDFAAFRFQVSQIAEPLLPRAFGMVKDKFSHFVLPSGRSGGREAINFFSVGAHFGLCNMTE